MASVTLPYTLTPGTPENVSQLMSNLTALRDGVNTIDTAQIADAAVTSAKLSTTLISNLGLSTNRATMTPMTTQRDTSSSTFVDVLGASTTFTVASGSYLMVGASAQVKGADLEVKVLAGSAVLNGISSSAEPATFLCYSDAAFYKVGALAIFPAVEVGTGSQTFKFQFKSGSGTASIDECYLTITQVTFA